MNRVVPVSVAARVRPPDWLEDPGPLPEGEPTRTLYHFTSQYHLPLIEKEGFIARGDVPITPKGGYNAPWLTADGSWGHQGWIGGSGVLKNGVRFTVEVPEGHSSLHHWPGLARAEGMNTEWYRVLTTPKNPGEHLDPDAWYVFKGRIPLSWVTATDFLKSSKPPEGSAWGVGAF